MLVAAYVVGGFLVASVYAVGMLRGRRDRYHRLGFLIPFTVAAIATPIQMVVGDSLARWVYNNQPTKFAAIELVPKTSERRARDAARAPQRRRHGERRHRRSRAWRRGCPTRPTAPPPSSRASTRSPRTSGRRPPRSTWCTSRGTSWSGIGTLLFLLALWYGVAWLFRRRHAPEPAVPAARRRRPGCSSVVAHGGRLGRHRGRPPAVDRLQPHEGRGRRDRQHRGVDHVHRRRRCCTSGLGVTTILVLRGHEPPLPAQGERRATPTCRTARDVDIPAPRGRAEVPVG